MSEVDEARVAIAKLTPELLDEQIQAAEHELAELRAMRVVVKAAHRKPRLPADKPRRRPRKVAEPVTLPNGEPVEV